MSKIVVVKTEGNPVIALKKEGWKRGKVDFITVMLFTKKEDAHEWCKKQTDLESSYWKSAEIINTGENA